MTKTKTKRANKRDAARDAAASLLRELHERYPDWTLDGIGTMFGNAGARLMQLRAAFDQPAAVLECEYARQGFAALVMTLGAFEAERLLGVKITAKRRQRTWLP